jgi:hypothetical protein
MEYSLFSFALFYSLIGWRKKQATHRPNTSMGSSGIPIPRGLELLRLPMLAAVFFGGMART